MAVEFYDYGKYTPKTGTNFNVWGQGQARETKEAEVKNVPVKQQQAPNETTGLDTFTRTGEVAQANYAMGGMNVKREVSTSPTAVAARAAEVYAGERQGILADECGMDVAATVSGVEPEILNYINVSPQLATYLNSADPARIEQAMQLFV